MFSLQAKKAYVVLGAVVLTVKGLSGRQLRTEASLIESLQYIKHVDHRKGVKLRRVSRLAITGEAKSKR
jgi:hypothetical protein